MEVLALCTRNVVSAGPGESIDSAIELMERHGIHHLPVVDGGRVVGMVSDRDILLGVGWLLASQREVKDARGAARAVGPVRLEQIMSRTVHALQAGETVQAAAQAMVEHKISALPVKDGERLCGILSERDVLNALLDRTRSSPAARDLLERHAADFMRSRVLAVIPETTLLEVVQLFRERRIRHLPVAVDGQLLGIISDRDTCRALGRTEVRLAQAAARQEDYSPPRFAGQIMNPDVLAASPETPMADALRLLLENDVHSLVILRHERLAGILTLTDFLREVQRRALL